MFSEFCLFSESCLLPAPYLQRSQDEVETYRHCCVAMNCWMVVRHHAVAKKKGPRCRGPFIWLNLTKRQCLISGGSLPPLAASLVMTCLCSQMFMLAESLLSPV